MKIADMPEDAYEFIINGLQKDLARIQHEAFVISSRILMYRSERNKKPLES